MSASWNFCFQCLPWFCFTSLHYCSSRSTFRLPLWDFFFFHLFRFSLNFIFYGILTCMIVFIQCAQYSQYVKIALTIHSNCLIYQCKGAAMKERGRGTFTYIIYIMFKIHKREHGMKQQQLHHHRTHRLNSTIDQEREQSVIGTCTESSARYKTNSVLNKNVRINGKLIINTHRKR